jgi:sporulation protein YlmC with PRC-barrel domain
MAMRNPDLMRAEAATRGAPRVMRSSTIVGSAVRNLKGDDLGKIQELMIDVATGRIAYAVLAYGGFLGMGDKLFAIPWEALMAKSDERQFVLDLDEETLKTAPGFDRDHYPTTADTNWLSNVYTHYGYTPYWTGTGEPPR